MQIYLAVLLGMLVTGVTGWLGIRIANQVGLIDMPGAAPHKKHANPTPLAGGIILMLSLAILTPLSGIFRLPALIGTLIGALIIFGFGIVDDLKIIRPLPKFLGQLLAGSVLIFSGNFVRVFENPAFPLYGEGLFFRGLDIFITLFWVIGVTNAFNFIDSMDGQCVGVSGLSFGFFLLGALGSQQKELAMLSALLVGICVVILFLNTKPSRAFLGDSGAQTLGFLMAATAILYNPLARQQLSSWFLPILLAFVPIFDTTLVTLSRFRRKTPFYKSGCDHTYHRLVALGLPPAHAVLLMVLAALFFDCLAFIALDLPALPANLIFAGCLVLFGVAFFLLDSKVVRSKLETPEGWK